MVKKYIMENTKYSKATGGTPIATWLPNKMGASLDYSLELINNVKKDELSGEDKEKFDMIKNSVKSMIDKLFKDVQNIQTDKDSKDLENLQEKR